MIDLFYPPVVRPRSATIVHRIEPAAGDEEPYSEIVPRKKRGLSKRAAYHRKYHAKNRAARLKRMRENYEAKTAEYFARAKKWAAENPKKYNEIQKQNQRRRRAKRLAAQMIARAGAWLEKRAAA